MLPQQNFGATMHGNGDTSCLLTPKPSPAEVHGVSIMTTYVADCALDAAKAPRTLDWEVVRNQFNANYPEQAQHFLGVARNIRRNFFVSWIASLSLSLNVRCAAKILEDVEHLVLDQLAFVLPLVSLAHFPIPNSCLNSRVIVVCGEVI